MLTVEDGVGTVSIEGPILRKPGLFARVLMGAVGSEEIGDALREAGERDDIRAVFLDIDSPGGTVAGTPELAAAVASLNKQKPVYGCSSGVMCSAAYWIASQASAVYATPSAQVGSIGVVQAVIDDFARKFPWLAPKPPYGGVSGSDSPFPGLVAPSFRRHRHLHSGSRWRGHLRRKRSRQTPLPGPQSRPHLPPPRQPRRQCSRQDRHRRHP